MGRELFWFTVMPIEGAEEGTDRWAVEQGWISLTPLRLDLTDEEQLAAARERLPLDEGLAAALPAEQARTGGGARGARGRGGGGARRRYGRVVVGGSRSRCHTSSAADMLTRMSSRSSGRWVLAASVLGSSMAFIDGNVVSVALPVLQQELGVGVSGAQWIVEAYALFLSSLVLVGGSLADRFGRKKLFSIGAALFALASLACGLAPGAGALIAARAVQGLGAALLVPSSLAMLGAAFPPQERGRAVGMWSALTSIASAVGPALGGWLVEAISWRAVFLINLPIAGAVLWIVQRRVAETRNPRASRLDLPGAVLATLGLGGLVYGLIEAAAVGWADPRAWGAAAAGVAGLFAFVVVERNSAHPMVPLSLFRRRTFAAANLLTLFLYAALAATFFFLPFVLIQARGYRPSAAGAATLPLVVIVSALSRTAGMLADRFGARLFLTVGPLVVGAGFLLFAILPAERRLRGDRAAGALHAGPRPGDHGRAVDRDGARSRRARGPGNRLRDQQRGGARRRPARHRRLRPDRRRHVQPRARPATRRGPRVGGGAPRDRARALEARGDGASPRTRARPRKGRFERPSSDRSTRRFEACASSAPRSGWLRPGAAWP